MPLPFVSLFPISNFACPVKANCFQVTSLCSRYIQAKELSKKATDHFLQLNSSVSANDQRVWEKEIWQAESCRLTMLESMDILGARILSDAHKVNVIYETTNQTPLEDWIQMAIDLEEKQ